MLLRKFSIAAAATLFIPLAGQVTQAATFTTQEVNEVHNFQKEYANLDKTSYSAANIYAKKPNLSKKFKVGRLDQNTLKRKQIISITIDHCSVCPLSRLLIHLIKTRRLRLL